MTLFIALVVRVQIIVMQNLKDLKSIFQDGGKDTALICSECSFVGKYEVDCFETGNFHRIIDIQILAEEGLSYLMSEGDAFFEQLGLDLLHIEGVVVQFNGVAIEAQFILFLVYCNEFILHHADCEQ